MEQLGVGEVEAVIMPERVGFYLAEKMDLNIRILWQPEIRVPVSFAVKNGDTERLTQLNKALTHLEQSGKLDEIRQRWNVQRWIITQD